MLPKKLQGRLRWKIIAQIDRNGKNHRPLLIETLHAFINR